MLIASFFRLWDLKNVPPGLWADEAVNGVNTLRILERGPSDGGWKVFYPENFGREGFFINIQSLFVQVLGTEPWVLRLPSAIFGILTVLGLLLMTRELFKTRVALFTSFFLATSFWHINFSRIGFRAIMAPFFLVWSFYFLFLGIRLASSPRSPTSDLQRSRTSSRALPEIIFAIAGILFGLGFHSYLAYRVAPIIALYPLWIFFKNYRAGKLRDYACAPCLIVLFILMAIIAASPLLIYYAKNPADFFGRTSGISIFQSPEPLAQFSGNFVKTFQMFFLFGDFNWRHNFAGSPELWWPLGLLFLIGIWQSLKLALPKAFTKPGAEAENFPIKFVLLWFIVMLLPVAVSNEGLPHALRAIVLIPPVMIFAALGLEILLQKIGAQYKNQKTVFTALLLAFFLAGVAHTYNTYFIRWAPDFKVHESFQADLAEKARWLKNQPDNIKKYVVTGETDKVDLTGSPMSLQPIIFITDTFYESERKKKNIYYVALKNLENISCENQCVIMPVESELSLMRAIKLKIPGLQFDISPGFVTFKK